jgi:protein TonB
MFDATLLESSPDRAATLTARHWIAALCVGALGSMAGYLGLPLISTVPPRALMIESVLLGIGVMFYELMIWYVMADARRLGFSVWKWSVALLALNVAGFVIYLVYSAAKTGEWKRAALPIAYLMEGVVVLGLLIVPLILTQALPNVIWTVTPTPPLPPRGPRAATPRARAIRRAASPTSLTPPAVIPDHIVMIREELSAPTEIDLDGGFVPGAIPGGGDPNGIPFGLQTDRDVPPPKVEIKPKKTGPLVVTSRMEEAKLIFRPTLEYPVIAKLAHIQGTVLLRAIIGKDGTIQDLKVVSGHPLLVRAAMEAVARWRYQPTLLDGEAVEVVTEVEVKFILNE